MTARLMRATIDDAADLAAFAAQSFRETYGSLMSGVDLDVYIAGAFGPAVQAVEIADGATTVILARQGDDENRRIVGYMQLLVKGVHLDLKRLYLDQTQKGRGLAASLIEKAREECRRLGLEKIRLTVWTRNLRAVAFYRKTGFMVTGSEIFMVGEDAQIDHVMEMVVPPDLALQKGPG